MGSLEKTKIDCPIIHSDYLKSLHRSFNNAWNNKAYSLVDKIRFVLDLRLLVMRSYWVSIDAGTNFPPPFTTSRMNSSLVSINTDKNAKRITRNGFPQRLTIRSKAKAIRCIHILVFFEMKSFASNEMK